MKNSKMQFRHYRTLSTDDRIVAIKFEMQQLEGRKDRNSVRRNSNLAAFLRQAQALKTLELKRERIKKIAEAFLKL